MFKRAVFALGMSALALSAQASELELTIKGKANGTVRIDLLEEVAPAHVERISTLAESGAYDGVAFHRVIEGFMAQTGDVQYGQPGAPAGLAGSGASDLPDVKQEFSDIRYERGTVGMARSRHPDSANSQFFIMFAPAPSLNGKYTVIGKVLEGMDVVDQIKRGTGPNGSVQIQPDRIQSARIVK